MTDVITAEGVKPGGAKCLLSRSLGKTVPILKGGESYCSYERDSHNFWNCVPFCRMERPLPFHVQHRDTARKREAKREYEFL